MPKVSIVKCDDYPKVKATIKKSIDLLGGVNKFFKKGDKVLLKPNMAEPLPPSKAANTHPLFVKAVIEILQKHGVEACVGECSAGGGPGITSKCLEMSGIGDVIKETGVDFKNFQEDNFTPYNIVNSRILEKTDFADAIFQADRGPSSAGHMILNLPKLKTHGITFITGSIKNCFGCIHPEERKYLHRNFPKRDDFIQGLIDVYSFVMPKLTIMDAVVGMEGDQGPSFGDPKKIGVVIASEDGVAVDAVAAAVTGHNPLALPIIRFANERSIGVGDLKKIEVIGEKIESVILKDFKQHPLFSNEYRKMQGFGDSFIMIPQLTTSKCVKCRTCADNCPVKAIRMSPYPVIDRNKCIMCYCCHELCPKGAYRLEIKWLGGQHHKRKG